MRKKSLVCMRGMFFLVALFSLLALTTAAQTRRPNVVLILSDDMGYADIGSYGAKDIHTPHLDRLAREGVRMTDCYSNGPVCTPTRAALMTGRYQQRLGPVMEWALTPRDRGVGLPTQETCVARMLKDAGYRAAIFGKWHLGFDAQFNPTAHGFDEFFGILSGNVDMYTHRYRDGTPDLYEKTEPVTKEGYLTDLITDRAVQFIERNAAGSRENHPFFVYVPFNAVHWPFQPPGDPSYARNEKTWFDGARQDYARMLEAMDAAIGRLLMALDKNQIANDTLVIFTNDNGGERLSDNRPFFHHKATLWEGGIRVPCLARWPARLPKGKTSAQAAMSMDLTATILAAAGVNPPAGRQLDGVNLLPILEGKAPVTERTLFWRMTDYPQHNNRSFKNQRAVRKGNWKYIWDGNVEQLFDLARDPGERRDLQYQHQKFLFEMRKLYAQWEKDVNQSAAQYVKK